MTLPQIYKDIPYNERWKVREEYARLQNNLCMHCEEPLNGPPAKDVLKLKINEKLFPSGFFNHPIHLHHDHESGYTIGVLHAKCNAVMWQYYGE